MVLRQLYKGLLVIALISAVIDVYACFTTFINDNVGWVIIEDHATGTLILVKKNEKRRFGNQQDHTNFSLYVQKSKTPVFSKIYTCEQRACSATGNVKLKFSEIERRKGSAGLFAIKEYESHPSMVQELPMMQEHCSSCNG